MNDEKITKLKEIFKEEVKKKEEYIRIKELLESMKKLPTVVLYEKYKKMVKNGAKIYDLDDYEFVNYIILSEAEKLTKDSGETEGIYMFSGAYKPSHDYRGPVFNGIMCSATTRDDKDAIFMNYVDIERVFERNELVFPIDEAKKFENKNTVIIPKFDNPTRAKYYEKFYELKKYYFACCIANGNEYARRLVLKNDNEK